MGIYSNIPVICSIAMDNEYVSQVNHYNWFVEISKSIGCVYHLRYGKNIRRRSCAGHESKKSGNHEGW